MVRRFLRRHEASDSGKSLMRASLVEALQTPACALCEIAGHNNPRYVETLLDESVFDVEQRDTWRAARGLCNWHAWMAVKSPQAAGSLAILYHDVLQYDLTQLGPVVAPDGDGNRRGVSRRFTRWLRAWLQAWRTGPTCPACRTWLEQERLYAEVLLNDWQDPALSRAFTVSVGLCWPHVRRLAAWQPGHENLPAFLKAQRACLERLQHDLESFIRKLDYRFADEPYGREADAWRRAAALYAGGAGWRDSAEPR
jgi:hypothetical protein